MAQRSETESLALRLWRQLYQTYTLLKKAEDEAAGSFGLTTEQYAVLVTLGYFGGTMKVSDIAAWLERTANSMSMIVDRMVKTGLITRKRDRTDRRLVYVTVTSQGKTSLEPVAGAMLELILKVLSPLSSEERNTLFGLLETAKIEIIKHLSPGADIQEVRKKELERTAYSRAWLDKYGLPSALHTRRRTGKKDHS
jgi:MarR family 2-MHQ and catechol resistance regulon transcriptional repressor